MNHKKSRVLAAAISSLLSFGMILQTAAPPDCPKTLFFGIKLAPFFLCDIEN